MPVVADSRPRRSTKWGRQAAGALLLALMLAPALIPWQLRVRRYSLYNSPYDVRAWRLARYVNSVGGGDVIEANGLGTLQIVFRRPEGKWGRPWPF
ncbi:MAG: hypothetical protein ACO1SX_10975 [Actinomycetota bacterium]